MTNMIERLFVKLNASPWDAIYRIVVGFSILPMLSLVGIKTASAWVLFLFLMVVLAALRVGPAVVRRVIRFSPEAQKSWMELRTVAKRYDSYQWQKLCWIGIGLALYTAYSGNFDSARISVSAFCLLTGTLGLLRWRTQTPIALRKAPAK